MDQSRRTNIIHFIQTIDQMEALPRTGYYFAGIQLPESLAAHAYGVVVIAMILVDMMDEPTDSERVLRMAVLHDMTESVLTDIPTVIFKYLGRDQKLKAENKAAEDLFANVSDEYLAVWQEFERGETLEARIVTCADKLQLALKILSYQRRGQGRFENLWVGGAVENDWWGIKPAAELYTEIERLFWENS